MRTTLTSTVAALSAVALTVGLAGTAHADRVRTSDPRDTHHGSDITGLTVRNGVENVHVVTTHVNLRRSPASGSGGVTYLDTDPNDRGPEYAFAAGYFVGTDYVLVETEGFGPRRWGNPVEHGDYIMKVNYRKDRVRVTMSRHALGDPTDVRVAVRASGSRRDGSGEGLVDWVGEPRSFTPWMAQG